MGKKDFVMDHLEDGAKIQDDYTIKDVLGSGAYGEVRKCIHLRTKEVRAVKIINKSLMKQKESERLKSEIGLLR